MSITSAGDITTATEVFSFPYQYSAPPLTTAVTWTNLGPLTTTFRAPASCSTGPSGALLVYDYSNPDDGLMISGNCQEYNFKVPPWIDCQPSGTLFSSLYWATVYWRASYLSPGIYCPAGYSTADAFVLASPDVSTASIEGNTLRTTGTHVFCCPSGFTSSLYSCWSSVSTATSTSLCDAACVDYTNVTLSNGRTTFSCRYTPSPFSWNPSQQAVTVQEWLDPVYMIHQQSDIPRKGLSTTDKIVIGVVVPVVVLFAVFVGGLCFMRRLKKRSQSESNAQLPIGLQAVERRENPKRPATYRRKWHWV